MKMIIGFALGITLVSAMAQNRSYIIDSKNIVGIQAEPTKVIAHLDAAELAAIKEACK